MFFLKNHVEKVKIENIKSNEVYAPVEGEVIPLDEVDDAVFSEKILGDGVAVEPDKGEIYSPVKGTVSVVFPTKHVVGITTEEGNRQRRLFREKWTQLYTISLIQN